MEMKKHEHEVVEGFPELGKIGRAFFARVIYPRLGASRAEVLLGPRYGADVAIVRLGNGKVLAATTDPLSLIPEIGPEDSAWLSVQLLASDLLTSGIPPAWALVDFNLPPHLPAEEFERYWEAMHREFERLGVAVIGGHTGKFEGCDYTIIGGGTLLGIGDEDRYICATTASPGDRLLVTKGAAIVTVGLFARVFPNTLKERLGAEFLERAQAFLYQATTVEDAQAALSVGVREEGVTALHDATEGGVLGAISELAEAAGLGVRVELERIPLPEEAAELCRLLGIDPYRALSEGALLIAARPGKAPEVLKALKERGIAAAEVGEFISPQEGRRLIEGGEARPLGPVEVDPYWEAFWRAVEEGADYISFCSVFPTRSVEPATSSRWGSSGRRIG